MKNSDLKTSPTKIICLTEESVETLFLLGKEDLISGVSAFVKRPKQAMELPKVSFFTSSNYSKILALEPDLIIGHSDIQKDIARDLIELGQNVFIANHRSVVDILNYIQMLANLVGERERGVELVTQLIAQISKAKEFAKTLQRKPRIYFEEWDNPQISAIEWVSEIIDICGGDNIFSDRAAGNLAKERFCNDTEVIEKNPDIIFGCWCGKKVKIKSIVERKDYDKIAAVQNKRVFELAPEIFLQPGPAPILDGIDILINYFKEFNQGEVK